MRQSPVAAGDNQIPRVGQLEGTNPRAADRSRKGYPTRLQRRFATLREVTETYQEGSLEWYRAWLKELGLRNATTQRRQLRKWFPERTE